jgi:SAM-dependent methyltransferase/uncharacterized protein YbaR (Trm112 family)
VGGLFSHRALKGEVIMNQSLLPHLASPVHHRQLVLGNGEYLEEVNGDGRYPVVEGIPVLLPDARLADWCNELLEVLFWERTPDVLAHLAAAPPEDWLSGAKAIIDAEYGTDGVRAAVAKYAELPENERLRGVLRAQASQHGADGPAVPRQALDDCVRSSTLESGRHRAQQAQDMASKWAVHIHDYAAAVCAGGHGVIVELGTGAGIGTFAVMEHGLGSSRMISLDVDYACVGNAVGLAKTLGIEEQVDPVVANYWFLPFQDESIDIVCSHYGVDESRETARVVREVARVLKVGGAFVCVSRTDPAVRLRKLIGHLGFSDAQMRELADQAHLYPGPDRFIQIASQSGLALQHQVVFTPETSHERAMFSFRKGRAVP